MGIEGYGKSTAIVYHEDFETMIKNTPGGANIVYI